MLVIVIMILFIVLLFVSVPISATLSVVLLAFSLLDPDSHISARCIIRTMLGGIDSFPLFTVPMFVLSGILMAKGGVSKKLFDVLSYLPGEHTAEIPCAVIVTYLFCGTISGSASTTVAAVGSITVSLLIRMGYDKVFVTTIIAVTSSLGAITPPSILFVLSGMTSGAGVGKVFMAGIIPGILIALLLMLYALYYCKERGEDKERIHVKVFVLHEKGFVKVFLDDFWALLTPVITLDCIYSRTAPPTEVAVISVFYALIISMCIYQILRSRGLKGILVETIRTFAPILSILSAAAAFSRIITLLQIPEVAGDFTLSTFSGEAAVLLVINVLLLIVGMVTDTLPAILILTPILVPIINGLRIDPVQSGVIMVINLVIGFMALPIGIDLFVASSLTDVPVMQITKKAMPLTVFFLIALLAITFIPQISFLLAL